MDLLNCSYQCNIWYAGNACSILHQFLSQEGWPGACSTSLRGCPSLALLLVAAHPLLGDISESKINVMGVVWVPVMWLQTFALGCEVLAPFLYSFWAVSWPGTFYKWVQLVVVLVHAGSHWGSFCTYSYPFANVWCGVLDVLSTNYSSGRPQLIAQPKKLKVKNILYPIQGRARYSRIK